jgi:hypothetical protein
LQTQVVDLEDIYDDFSWGRKSSRAIRDFLRFAATNWQRRPQFVLLAGDATYDPRGYLSDPTTGTPEAHLAANAEFVRSLCAQPQAATLGQAANAAKRAAANTGIRRTWVLLGDPTMRLR